jgi:hypothetical protein
VVRPRDDRADRGTFVGAGRQALQPRALVAQLGDQLGEARRGPGGGQLGGDAQRQRQARAALHQRDRRYGLGRDPAADEGAEQVQRLGRGEPRQVDTPRAVPRDQTRQGVPAGDQRQAGRRAE